MEPKHAADLDRAIRAELFGTMLPGSAELAEDRTRSISASLGEAVAYIVQNERSSCDVAISAHLEGIEVSQTYTLYRCRGQGRAAGWERVTHWEVSRQAARDDVFAVAAGLNPLDSMRLGRLGSEFQPHVRRYIERW